MSLKGSENRSLTSSNTSKTDSIDGKLNEEIEFDALDLMQGVSDCIRFLDHKVDLRGFLIDASQDIQ
jgi:hypothetical protein